MWAQTPPSMSTGQHSWVLAPVSQSLRVTHWSRIVSGRGRMSLENLWVFGVTSFFWEWNIYHLINQTCGFIGHLCDRSHQKRRGKNPSAVACTRESEDRTRDTELKDCFPFSWGLAWFCHQLCQGLWGLPTSPCSHCSSSCWESPKPHLNSCYLKHFPRIFLSLLQKYFT